MDQKSSLTHQRRLPIWSLRSLAHSQSILYIQHTHLSLQDDDDEELRRTLEISIKLTLIFDPKREDFDNRLVVSNSSWISSDYRNLKTEHHEDTLGRWDEYTLSEAEW